MMVPNRTAVIFRERDGRIMKYDSKEAVISNLRDAGCDTDTIAKFLQYRETGETNQQLRLLAAHRAQVLEHIHQGEKRITCLDYLIYQIKNSGI